MTPKTFISYSWSSQEHQNQIIEWADRLLSEGIEVVLDVYDFKEGDEKNSFMESMVTDSSITHVLVMGDKQYAEKANARKAGVGTESQIISEEVYNKITQSKFIPIVCEFLGDGSPALPVFLKSRKWIDFSSLEATNKNWEQLIRLLFNKPLHKKPKLGTPPAYITSDEDAPPNAAEYKLKTLRQALLEGKKGIPIYRQDFLDACISFADSMRIREQPSESNLGEKILDDCKKLKTVRN